MKSNYEPLGKHIQLVDYRNSEEVTSTVLGISIDKEFMPSVANVIGTDLSRYKLISKGLFACNPMHVGRDERLPIALYEKDSPAIVSPAYFMFEIIDRDVLNEEYLMMWFRRPEFDRECWFMTDGSVRGGITWEDLCRIKLPVPSYARQCEIVESYRAITDRIALKRAENDNLEATAQAVFQDQFASYYGCDKLPEGYSIVSLDSLCTVKGGKRLPADCELLDDPTEHPYIRVRDVGGSRYVCLTDQFQYIDEETHLHLVDFFLMLLVPAFKFQFRFHTLTHPEEAEDESDKPDKSGEENHDCPPGLVPDRENYDFQHCRYSIPFSVTIGSFYQKVISALW